MLLQIEGNCCSSCAFSADDALVAFGMQNGKVLVYDTESGNLLWTLGGGREKPVRELAFVENQNLLVSVDEKRRCVVWELKNEPICLCETDFSSGRQISHILSTEKPCLSENGRFLAIPVLQDSAASSSSSTSWRITTGSMNIPEFMSPRTAQSMHVHVYSTLDHVKKSGSKHPTPLHTLSVRMDVDSAIIENMDIVQFSPSASRILLLACEGDSPYLVLWPSLCNQDISFKLQGNRGVFSSDERYLATWFDPCPSAEHTCLVWDMEQLEATNIQSHSQSYQHPRFHSFDPIRLQDERFENILACGFVSVHSKASIAMCYSTERIQMVIWSLSMQTPMCIIDRCFDVTVQAISFSVSSDQRWICLNAPMTGDVTIWNAEQGIEVFHTQKSHPERPSEHFWSDVLLGHTSRYMLLAERNRADLLNLTALHSMCPSPYIVLNGSETETIERQPIFKFSPDGQFIGLLMAPGNCLDVWSLQNRRHLKLDWKGIVQAHRSRPKGNHTTSFQVDLTFHQFALSQNGNYAATCMGDSSVLLWQLKRSIECHFVATLPSDCFLPRDICFSNDPSGMRRLVVCQDQGDLIWLDPDQSQIVKIVPAEGSRLCRFSVDGTRAVTMSDLFTVHIWDLVHQTELQCVTYQIPLLSPQSSLLEPNILMDGRFLAGFDENMKPLVYEHHLSEETHMDRVNGVAFGVSDNGEWGVTMHLVSDHTEPPNVDDRSRASTYSKRPHALVPRNSGTRLQKSHTSTLSLVPLTGKRTQSCISMVIGPVGDGVLKSMQLPDSLSTESHVIFSADGKHCAAVDNSHRLVVWNAHMTKRNLIQECVCLQHAIYAKEPAAPHLIDLLQTHGGALLNSRDENGMTVVMHSVYDQNQGMLKELLGWALAEGCKVTLEGPIRIPETNITAKNIVDLSFHVNNPEITEVSASGCAHVCIESFLSQMLLFFIVEGVTTEMSMAQIFEASLMDVASLYPSLFTELVDNPKLMRPLSIVNIPGKWVSDARHLAITTHDNLLPSAKATNQIWKSKETKQINRRIGRLRGYISAEALVIPIPHLTHITTGSVLHRLNTSHLHDAVYGSDIIRALVEFKFNAYGRRIVQREFYVHLVLLTSFTFMAMILAFGGIEHRTVLVYFAMSLSSVISTGNLLSYLRTAYDIFGLHGLDGLSILHELYVPCMTLKCFGTYLLVAFIIPICFIWCPASPLLGTAVGISSLVLWMRLVQFFETSDSVGSLIVAIEEVVQDISWFLILLLMSVIGFGISLFFIINISPPDFEEKYEMIEFDRKNPFHSILVAIMLTLSDVGNIFEAILKKEGGIRQYIVMGFVVFYVNLVAIILLNVIIAMMGDSYDRVRNSEGALFTKRKAQVMHGIELRLSQRAKHEINTRMGRYLHVTRLRDGAMAPMAPWRGRLNAICESHRQENRELQRSFTKQLSDLDTRFKRMEQQLSNRPLHQTTT